MPSRVTRRSPWAVPLVVLALVFVASGCRIVVDDAADRRGSRSTVEAEADGDIVPLEVVEGPNGSTLVFVPVFIREQGPFPFALDTGASRTSISATIAEELGLAVTGRTEQVSGVVGVTEAPVVEVDDWTVGEIDLGPSELVAVDLGPPGGEVEIGGLLGSDVLERFERVTLDYGEGVLILGE